MSCGCNDSGMINSWIDWASTAPQNPQDIIANATLVGVQGTYLNSSTFATPPSGTAWVASPITITALPVVTALGTDNLLNVSNASEWTFSHLTANLNSSLPIPLRKVIFLRGGLGWVNDIKLNFGGSSYSEIQLSFRDNAGTRGDMAGTVPVITWPGSVTGTVSLMVTLKTLGRVTMGIRALHSGGTDVSMYESEWIIVP